MNRLAAFIKIAFMFFIADISAQEHCVQAVQWKVAGILPGADGRAKGLGVAGPVAGVCNNVFMIAGGANFPDGMPWKGGRKKYYADIFIYKKAGNKLVLNEKRFRLPSTVAYAACASTPAGIIYTGGENENGISSKSFLLQWDEISKTVIIKNLPDMPLPLTNAAATAIGNTVYITGGETTGRISSDCYSLNLTNDSEGWKQLPSLPHPVSHAVLVSLPNSSSHSLYLIGGREKNAGGISKLYGSVFELDIHGDAWIEKNPLPYAVSAGTGMGLCSGDILIFGGDRGETFHQSETFTIEINAEKDEIKKQQLIENKNKLLSSHPGFSKDVLLYYKSSDQWSVLGVIPFDSPVTTNAVKWDEDVLIPSGEIRAGVRTPQILIAEIKSRRK